VGGAGGPAGATPDSSRTLGVPPEMSLRRSRSVGAPAADGDLPAVGADPATLFSFLPPTPTHRPVFFDDIANDEVAAVVEELFTDATFATFEWDVASLELRCGSPLLVLGTAVLDRPHSGLADEPEEATGVWSRLHIDRGKGMNFLRAIDEGYLKRNPYHNSTHAANVVWHANYLVQRCGLKHWLTLNEWFATIIAAAVHDFAHPGLTNAYLVKANAAIAIQHNDLSVLERFHVAEAFKVSRRADCRIFDGMEPATYREVRKHIVDCVLSTDVSQHFGFIADLKKHKVQHVDPDKTPPSPLSDAAGSSGGASGGAGGSGSGIIHGKMATVPTRDILRAVCAVADLGHAALPWELHVKWSQRVQEEFFRQGDLERAKGVEVSPLSDRTAADQVPKNQVGFYQYLVSPLFRAVGEALPLDNFDDVMMRPAMANMARWEHIAQLVSSGKVSIDSDSASVARPGSSRRMSPVPASPLAGSDGTGAGAGDSSRSRPRVRTTSASGESGMSDDDAAAAATPASVHVDVDV